MRRLVQPVELEPLRARATASSKRPSSASRSISRSSAAARSRRTESWVSRCQSSKSTLSRRPKPASRSSRCRSHAAVRVCDRRVRIGREPSGTRRGRTRRPSARGRPSRGRSSSRPSPSAVRSVERVRRSAARERSGSASGQSRFATTARVWVCPVTARYASIAVALRVSTDSGCPSTSMRGAPRSEILSGFTGHSMSAWSATRRGRPRRAVTVSDGFCHRPGAEVAFRNVPGTVAA